MPIILGMVATVDVKTGENCIPIPFIAGYRMKQALSER